MEKIKIDLGKYDVVLELGLDKDVEISVYEKSIYYKRSLSEDELILIHDMISFKKSISITSPKQTG